MGTFSYEHPVIKLRKKKNGEMGLFATRKIKKGEITSISAGMVLPLREVKKSKYYTHYGYFLEKGFFLVPFTKELDSNWFMNHSCNPNTGGTEALTNYALRDIKKGEEITYDYTKDYTGYKDYKPFRKFKCKCGSKNCKKVIWF